MAVVKGREIILGTALGREAAALIVDGALDDLVIDTDGPRLGAVYRARADRPVKGIGGMFLHGPDGPLFLRQTKGVAPGDWLTVQVTGLAEPGKAVPVTTRLLFKSRYAIVTPNAPGLNVSRAIKDDAMRDLLRGAALTAKAEASPHGIILRSACEDAEADDIAADVDAMLAAADAVLAHTGDEPEKLVEGDGPHGLAWRDWQAETARDGDLGDWLQGARASQIALGNEGSMAVEPTRALVAVDVNSPSGAGLAVNVAAAKALPRALRVRGLGGQVVVDFAPMPKKQRSVLEQSLRAAFRADTVETSFVGWTPLGHAELSRKRDRPALHEVS